MSDYASKDRPPSLYNNSNVTAQSDGLSAPINAYVANEVLAPIIHDPLLDRMGISELESDSLSHTHGRQQETDEESKAINIISWTSLGLNAAASVTSVHCGVFIRRSDEPFGAGSLPGAGWLILLTLLIVVLLLTVGFCFSLGCRIKGKEPQSKILLSLGVFVTTWTLLAYAMQWLDAHYPCGCWFKDVYTTIAGILAGHIVTILLATGFAIKARDSANLITIGLSAFVITWNAVVCLLEWWHSTFAHVHSNWELKMDSLVLLGVVLAASTSFYIRRRRAHGDHHRQLSCRWVFCFANAALLLLFLVRMALSYCWVVNSQWPTVEVHSSFGVFFAFWTVCILPPIVVIGYAIRYAHAFLQQGQCCCWQCGNWDDQSRRVMTMLIMGIVVVPLVINITESYISLYVLRLLSHENVLAVNSTIRLASYYAWFYTMALSGCVLYHGLPTWIAAYLSETNGEQAEASAAGVEHTELNRRATKRRCSCIGISAFWFWVAPLLLYLNYSAVQCSSNCDKGICSGFGWGVCTDCSDDYVGQYCQYAPAYRFSGCNERESVCGLYVRVELESNDELDRYSGLHMSYDSEHTCNGAPKYRREHTPDRLPVRAGSSALWLSRSSTTSSTFGYPDDRILEHRYTAWTIRSDIAKGCKDQYDENRTHYEGVYGPRLVDEVYAPNGPDALQWQEVSAGIHHIRPEFIVEAAMLP